MDPILDTMCARDDAYHVTTPLPSSDDTESAAN
jgi:hypothetical protein